MDEKKGVSLHVGLNKVDPQHYAGWSGPLNACEADAEDNPLKNAPHPVEDLAGNWTHGYSRDQAVYPASELRQRKFWAPVGRIDNVYGDRNLVCSFPPPEAWDRSAEDN